MYQAGGPLNEWATIVFFTAFEPNGAFGPTSVFDIVYDLTIDHVPNFSWEVEEGGWWLFFGEEQHCGKWVWEVRWKVF